MIAYIAGPMARIPEFNFPAFDEARDGLHALGYEVISPADLDRAVGFDPHTSKVDKQFLDEAMARDVDAVMRADCIVMLPGWETSTGAKAELALARWKHIPAYEWPSMREIPKESKVADPKAEVGSKKCPMYLLPPEALRKTAWAHALGAGKYGPYNWRETGVELPTYISAIMRHLMLVHDGEWIDPESGQPHVAHIAASCNILMDADMLGKLRPPQLPLAIHPPKA